MKLKQARKKHGGYTQEELAGLIGVSTQTVANWEAGRSNPSLVKWKKAAEVLGITVSDLEFEEGGGKESRVKNG
jgi:DNA-binding XRE family transcriptional regulator